MINQHDNRLENISTLIDDIYSYQKIDKPSASGKILFSNTLFDDYKLFKFYY